MNPARRAPSAAARTPPTGRTRPSSASSPSAACPASAVAGICREAARIASAIGRSKPEPSFRRPGRSEVDGDPPDRPLELGRRDADADALLRLLAGAVGEADDREAGDAELEVRLDLDAARLEADERVRDRPREHGSTVARDL